MINKKWPSASKLRPNASDPQSVRELSNDNAQQDLPNLDPTTKRLRNGILQGKCDCKFLQARYFINDHWSLLATNFFAANLKTWVISDCYLHELASIATQYMPIRVQCSGALVVWPGILPKQSWYQSCGEPPPYWHVLWHHWHVLWYVLVVCIEYTYKHVFNTTGMYSIHTYLYWHVLCWYYVRIEL